MGSLSCGCVVAVRAHATEPTCLRRPSYARRVSPCGAGVADRASSPTSPTATRATGTTRSSRGAPVLVHELGLHIGHGPVDRDVRPPERVVDGGDDLGLGVADDRLRVHPHPDLVERLGQLLAPADDVRLDLRRGPGVRHRAASVVVPPGSLLTVCRWTVCQLTARDRTVRTPGYAGPMSERLQPGDTAPAFTLPDADGNEVSLAGPQGPQGHRLLLPGRPDPRLHQAGLRLHRQPGVAGRRGLRRHRHLPGQAGEAGEVPREGDPEGHAARPTREGGPDRGVRRLRREEALRQDRTRASSAPRSSSTRRARSSAPCTTSRRRATWPRSSRTWASEPPRLRSRAARTGMPGAGRFTFRA